MNELPIRRPTPTVSVVMPVYNGDPFLRQSLDSILAQSYPDFEVIVVDDGSTDDTPQILASYGSRIRTYRKPNGGGASAINYLTGLAHGEWVASLSADALREPPTRDGQAAPATQGQAIGPSY